MIISCPNCQSKYRIAENEIKPEGSRVRCSYCKHIFSITPEDAESETADKQNGRDSEEIVQEDQGSGEQDIDDFEAKEDDETDWYAMQIQNQKDFDHPLQIEIEAEENSRSKPRWLWLVSSLLVVLLVGGGYFLFPKLKQILPFMDSSQEKQEPAQKDTVSEEEVKDIELENVRQFFVSNEKIGELFVIEGLAVNKFSSTRELIKIQAQLYDKDGQPLLSKTFMCGNTVSLFQLQVLQKDELESALNAKAGILSNNTNLEYGEGVAFMVAFYNPPEEVEEFGLQVVQAKHPPEE